MLQFSMKVRGWFTFMAQPPLTRSNWVKHKFQFNNSSSCASIHKTWKCNLLFAAFFAFVLVDLLLWNDICSSSLATWLHLFAKYTLHICQLHIDLISSQSPFCQVTKFVSWTNSLSPCCQVHFTKSLSSYQELVESMLSKSILPSHQVHIMNLLSPCCQVHFAMSSSLYH